MNSGVSQTWRVRLARIPAMAHRIATLAATACCPANRPPVQGLRRPPGRVALIVAMVTACAATTAPSFAAPSAATDDMSSAVTSQAQRRGTLYRVEDDAKPAHVVWLFGTIHVGRPDWYPLPREVMTAFGTARRLVLETDLRDTAAVATAVARHALYPDGEQLDAHVSVQTYALLRDTAARLHVPITALSAMRPFAVATLLSELALQQDGYRADLGVDQMLLRLASDAGKPVEGIESPEFQMQLFSRLGGNEQEAMLREQLEGMRDGSAQREMQTMVNAWAHADSLAIEGLLAREAAKGTATAAWMRDVLIDARNARMAQAVQALLPRPGPTFVAVGMAHLAGKNGIPQLLAQRGLHVKKIY